MSLLFLLATSPSPSHTSTTVPKSSEAVLSPTSTSEQDTDTKVTGSSNSPTIMQSATPTPALPTVTQPDSSTLTNASITPTNAAKVKAKDSVTQPDSSTLTNASITPTNATEGKITVNDKANTPTSLPNTTQQQNTSTAAGKITVNDKANTPTSLPNTTQQQNTSTAAGKDFDSQCQNLNYTDEANSPSCNTSHQQNTSTTNATGLSPTSIPSQTPSITVKGVGNDTTSPPHSSTGSPTSIHSSSTSPSPPPTTILSGTTEVPCQYRLIVNGYEKNSLLVNINGSKSQNYTIRIKDKKSEKKIPVSIVSDTTTIDILFEWLKPCTNYSVNIDNCNVLGENHFNLNVLKSVNHSAEPKGDEQVCFKDSKWNLTKCVNITTEDSCVQKPIQINLETCNYTMNVHMPPVKPEITFSESIPTKFVWSNKPLSSDNVTSQCKDTFKVKCTDDTEYDLDKDVFLKPSEEYTCTGKYKYYNTSIDSKSKQVNIHCEWINETVFSVTSNSIVILWNLSPGDKCKGITWEKYSGICKTSHGNTQYQNCIKINDTTAECDFSGLKSYTDYTCTLSAEVNKSIGVFPIYTRDFNQRTNSSNPSFEDHDNVKVKETSHNSFNVNCKNLKPDEWNGPKGIYIAKLLSNRPPVTKENPKSCSFTFENLYYHTEYTIEIIAINGNKNESSAKATHSTRYNDKALIGFLVFLILVTSLALLFVLYKLFLLKRKRTAEDEEILLTQPLRRVEPIYAGGLVEAYKNKIADEGRLFMDEFQSIPRIFSNYTIKEAKKSENQYKNRYVDILPYDYNRVTLSTGGEDNYINASFIEGYREPKKYIAAQGPKDETVVDFWRMVWEQKSSIIVMVTRCEEGNKTKCAQYWPSLDRETEIFEDFVVKIRSEEHCPDYVIRHLILNNKREKGSEREVTHIQFISWPDHGVPGDPSLLLKLRRRVNSFKNFFSGPVVVHCSAGVGRTGTYMSIDAMIESLEAEGRVDIYGFVAKLRRQRCLMVQVEAQYILIHTALIEYNQFGETEVSLSEFHSVLNTLRQKNGSDPSLLEKEFQKLPKFKKWRTMNTGSSEDNKKKNRDSAVIPYDFNRVIFRLDIEGNQTSDPEDEEEYSSDEEEESNQYINASFIDGYWCNKSLIAAQGPLPSTAEEFLLMLYQQQTKTLVMLTDCQEDGKDYCFQYWGDEKKTYGDMEIEVKKTETFPTYVRRHLEIQSLKKKEVLKVDQYQFLKWRGRELPENAQELVEMASIIRENGHYDNSKTNRNVPIVVHCNNGSSRTGIFCALWNLLDSAYTEKLVDVLQEVKNLRKLRQGMVETIEQYQFLYTALEGAFPVQNGAVKTPPAKDAAQVINETTALLTEPNSTSGADQKEAEESTAAESNEQGAKESSTAEAPAAEGDGEKATSEGPTNGPTATVEV
uniref:Receptor-type tyrosine-protein phosphatase C n=1 Tax=Cyprinus carpio TaxID=7962 RepID=A0A8C1QDV7_CYPCA